MVLLAFKSVLVPQPLKDALGRVPLLSGRPAVRLQDGVNYAGEGLNLRFARRPLPRVALGRRIGQHLAHRVPMQAKHSGGLPNAHPLHQAGPAHPKIRVPRENIHRTFQQLIFSFMEDTRRYSFQPPESAIGPPTRYIFSPSFTVCAGWRRLH